MNKTVKTFGYPNTLIHEYEHMSSYSQFLVKENPINIINLTQESEHLEQLAKEFLLYS